MEFTVKSPLIPLLLKQKIINSNNENVGYITGTELKRHFLGRMSYKLLYTDLEVEVVEQKKIMETEIGSCIYIKMISTKSL